MRPFLLRTSIALFLAATPVLAAELSDPARHGFTVTKSDTVDLPTATTGLYVGGTGNIQVTMLGGEVVIFNTVPVGMLPIRATRVWSTNTTATGMIALW